MCIHLYRNDLVLLCPERIVEVEPRCPFLPDHEPHEPMLDRSDILSSDVVATKIGYLVFTCCHYNYRPLVLYNAVHLQALGSWCWQRQRPHRTGWWDGNGITSNMLLEANKISIKREANITKLKECWHMLTLVLAMHSLPLGSCWFQETARALRIPLHWHSLKQHWESSQADMFLRSLTSLMPSRHPRQDHRYPPNSSCIHCGSTPSTAASWAAWCASDLCHVRIPWWDFSGLSTPSHLWEHPACPRKLSLKKIVILTIPMEMESYAPTVQFALKTRGNQMKSRWFRTSTRFMLPSASTAHN